MVEMRQLLGHSAVWPHVDGAIEAEREEVLKVAYPVIPERVDEDAADFDYDAPEPGANPVDWNYASRMLIHKLMRIAHVAGHDNYLLETLEKDRERVSAQLAFALTRHEERRRG